MTNSRHLLRTLNFCAIGYALCMTLFVYTYQPSPLRNWLIYICLAGMGILFILQFFVFHLIYLECQAEKCGKDIAEIEATVAQCTKNIGFLKAERDSFVKSVEMDTARLMEEINRLDTEAERVEAGRKAVAYLTEKYKSKKTHKPN